jgi:hypothetical protein
LQVVRATRAGLKTEVKRHSVGTAAMARKEAPKAIGLLKSVLAAGQSVTYENDGLIGIVRIPTPSRAFIYSPFVEGVYNSYELGRKPGRAPPFAPILAWVKIKGLASKWGVSEKSAAFLVQRKIKRRGTPAQPFIKPAVEHYEPLFKGNCERVLRQAAQNIARAR